MQSTLSNDATDNILLNIAIPSCPASLTKIMQEAKRSSVNVTHLANLINHDAGILGPLLKLANSPFVGLRNKVTSVSHAINVLGMQNTLNLVQNISLRQSVSSSTHNFEKFWERSSLSASVAEKIAAKLRTLDISKDDAYLAALFHDCGIPILIMKFPKYRETLMSETQQGKSVYETENHHFSTNHPIVGSMLTRNWMLPAHISKAVLLHHDTTIFSANDGSISTDVLNLIGVVHMAECITDEHFCTPNKEWPHFEHDVLKHFEMTTTEFAELKGDILAELNGE